MVLKFVRVGTVLTAGLVVGFAPGCGQDPYGTVPVTGRVLCNGKPAWGGTVIFQPIDKPDETGRESGSPGRAASGLVQEDGSFRLTVPAAGGAEDAVGAVVGRHRISFLMPKTTPWTMHPEDRQLPPDEQARIKEELSKRPVYPELSCGPKISPAEVEVKPGENVFEFTLQ